MVKTIQKYYKKLEAVIERRPLLSFFSGLIILLLLILLSNFLSRPAPEKKKTQAEKKTVAVYKIGTVPKISAQAQIEKTGVITLTALMPGVIQEINVYEGQPIGRGANLIWMSNNYQGGNILSLQRELAVRQYQNVLETYALQRDLIAKQRDLAAKTKSNTDELRDITQKSIDETKSLISLNEDIFDSLDTNLTNLQNTNANGSNDSLILTTKQLQSQVLAGLNQARAALRQTEYQVNTDKPPTELAELQKDLTLRQLDLQEKALNLSVEVSRVQLQIAVINEATMHPVAPIAGIVQKVHVRLGEAVNPGQPLVTIAGDTGELHAVAYISQQAARRISRLESSYLYIDGNKIAMTPTFISAEATQGSLYAVKYVLPREYSSLVTDKGFIRVEIPLGYADTMAAIPFIPLDAVYQNKDTAYVFINDHGTAKSRLLKLGQVYGQFVQVDSGLYEGDRVIVDRNVLEGDRVEE